MNDDSTPATKADINRLDGNIQRLETQLREMAKGLHASIDQVLTVLVNVNKRLTDSVENHERRLTRLEAHAGIRA